MQVIIEPDEAWSLMSVITSYVIDASGVSTAGKGKVRDWRSAHAAGTAQMNDLSEAMNEALGAYIGEATNRQIRGKRYKRAKESA